MPERLSPKTPVVQKSVRSIKITFDDGSVRDIFVQGEATEGYYKSESLGASMDDHSVYIVNGLVRDTPTIEIGID